MPSKAQGLSLNTIVIAAIVLVVLLVLVGLTTGYFRGWRVTFGKLSDTGCKGDILPDTSDCPNGYRQNYAADVEPGKICCISVAAAPLPAAPQPASLCGNKVCDPGEDQFNCDFDC